MTIPRLPSTRLWLDEDEIIVDSFAGGGGASQGIRQALGFGPHIAINHDAEAIALHRANHPESEHYIEDVWKVDPRVAVAGRKVGLMWLSPDCKHFSKAKGGKPVSPRVRGLAWVAVRWAKAVRPRLIILENVEEFQQWGPIVREHIPGCTGDHPIPKSRGKRGCRKGCQFGRPDKSRRGLSFRIFVGRLRGLGYTVEYRELRAKWYGAPTIRKRLFLIARCDGQRIVWPRPSHGKDTGRPYRTTAECLDFSIPVRSIFGRSKPLADNTMRRIARGMQRFVLDNPKPYIVPVTHQGDARVHSIDEPMRTITGAHRGEHALVAPILTKYHGERRPGEMRAQLLEAPLPTLDTSNRFGLVAPVLVPRYGERDGQDPRCRAVDTPHPTIVPTANGASLVTAFMAKHFGGHEATGHQLSMPLSTVKARDSHALVTSSLMKLSENSVGQAVDEPLHTVMPGATRFAEVRAFLISYYSTQQRTGDLFDPLPTISTLDRFGLVTVAGQDYQIVDIGMRMLEPRELYRCQGFPDSYRIDIPYRGKPLSKEAQVRMVGNSVCPDVAAALVRANLKRAAVRTREVA